MSTMRLFLSNSLRFKSNTINFFFFFSAQYFIALEILERTFLFLDYIIYVGFCFFLFMFMFLFLIFFRRGLWPFVIEIFNQSIDTTPFGCE